MNTENNEPRKYNRYDENFKRSAVELLLHGGKLVATIATELGGRVLIPRKDVDTFIEKFSAYSFN
jgi:transposase-like protein